MREKLKVGITIGDVNGVGLEVIIKSLMDNRILDFFIPIVYGNTKVASFHRKAIGVNDFSFQVIDTPATANPKRPNMINCWQEDVKITLGEENEIGGKYAFLSLERAVKDLNEGLIDVLVTAPINKNNIQQEGFKFPGHTEYLQDKTKSKDVLMFMIAENLRVGVVTGHIPLKDVAGSITEDLILSKLTLMNECLKKDFWIEKPKIAVLGLNPHAGDNGLIGKEDEEIIVPAIKKANEKNILAFGPYPADGLFAGDSFRKFDAVLAMYHDQGLIPFKHIASRKGINYTAGLPVVRTSPDHGTGYDIAGKNQASHESFVEAIFQALHIYKRRVEKSELKENALPFKKLSKDRD